MSITLPRSLVKIRNQCDMHVPHPRHNTVDARRVVGSTQSWPASCHLDISYSACCLQIDAHTCTPISTGKKPQNTSQLPPLFNLPSPKPLPPRPPLRPVLSTRVPRSVGRPGASTDDGPSLRRLLSSGAHHNTAGRTQFPYQPMNIMENIPSKHTRDVSTPNPSCPAPSRSMPCPHFLPSQEKRARCHPAGVSVPSGLLVIADLQLVCYSRRCHNQCLDSARIIGPRRRSATDHQLGNANNQHITASLPQPGT